MEQGASQVNNSNFEKEVCVQRLACPWTGAIIESCRCALLSGGELHFSKRSESLNPDVGQHQVQGELIASAGSSTNTKGFTELLKNVTLLEAGMGRLMDKVSHEQSDLP
jgi:hypothetical protein